MDKSNRSHIAQIYLDLEQRGNGYRSKIIEYIENLSFKNKFKTLAITAMKKDKSSRELYRRLGFIEGKESGNRIYMEKEIS